MDDAELIAHLREELRGERPWNSTVAEERLILAAVAAEVRDLWAAIRGGSGDGG